MGGGCAGRDGSFLAGCVGCLAIAGGSTGLSFFLLGSGLGCDFGSG